MFLRNCFTVSEVNRAYSQICGWCYESDAYCTCLSEIECFDEQSGIEQTQMNVSTTSVSQTQQNVQFHDQNESWKVDISQPGFESTYSTNAESDVSIANFLARPVEIYTSDWSTTNPAYADSFNPWVRFFQNDAVKSKVRYYHNIRCRLHLKFVINGNPFLYGRVVAAYTPLHTYTSYPNLLTAFKATATRATSRPHIFIDPTSSQAGEMVLPFFWWRNYFRATAAEWTHAGIIDFMAMSKLKHANGADMACRITVFAWAEDVSLTAPTNTVGLLASQSGGGDEYDRKFSTMATTAASLTNMLSRVPVIGPYARASSMVMGKAAEVARIFGYSRPVDTEISQIRPTYLGNMANVNVPDSSFKLSTDVKQEVTIDSRTVGLNGTDEMTIQSVASRSAYLFTIPWAFGTATGVKIGSLGVTPYCASRYIAGEIAHWNLLPCCHAAVPFKQWRGTMKYRFQIVASNYHKGRLVFQYDPHDSSARGLNVAYNKIVDISEEKDFTIEVGWSTPSCYLEARDFTVDGDNYVAGTTNIAYNENYYNGQLSVWVLNDLTAPTSGDINNDIEIHVFACCGDDFEFQNPSQKLIERLTFHPEEFVPPPLQLELDEQSGVSPTVANDMETTTNPLQPIATHVDSDVGQLYQGESKLSDVCYGERIVSFRSLIKRYALHEIIGISNMDGTTQSTSEWYTFKRSGPAFPAPSGAYANAFHEGAGGKYGFFNTPLLSWLTMGYAARRGGVRMKFAYLPLVVPGSSNYTDSNIYHFVRRMTERSQGEQRDFRKTAINPPANCTYSMIAATYPLFPGGAEGMIMQPASQQPVLEAEIPWASPYRFAPAQKDSPLNPWEPAYEYTATYLKQASTNGAAVFKYVAAADDFSLFFYIGCPPVSIHTEPLPI